MAKTKKTENENDVDGEETGAKKTPILIHVVVFLLITAAAAGAGFGASMFFKTNGPTLAMLDSKDGSESQQDTKNKEKEGEESPDKDKNNAEVLLHAFATPLAPILTNLAAPKDLWIRMELAVVAKDKIPDELLEKIHQDLFSYMRTVKLNHIEGPSGFINLKAELTDRASTRSGGAVKMVLVRTLVLE